MYNKKLGCPCSKYGLGQNDNLDKDAFDKTLTIKKFEQELKQLLEKEIKYKRGGYMSEEQKRQSALKVYTDVFRAGK